jgi:hypothetical protein
VVLLQFPDNASGERFRLASLIWLRGAGYCDEQFNVLLRHAKATLTGRYDIMPEGMRAGALR